MRLLYCNGRPIRCIEPLLSQFLLRHHQGDGVGGDPGAWSAGTQSACHPGALSAGTQNACHPGALSAGTQSACNPGALSAGTQSACHRRDVAERTRNPEATEGRNSPSSRLMMSEKEYSNTSSSPDKPSAHDIFRRTADSQETNRGSIRKECEGVSEVSSGEISLNSTRRVYAEAWSWR